ncbi:hypothetical protein [Paenibacillus monticola]|uniref:WXG100 family type VII secretion target n=1 Tax=Paenibacillus monticola TaxID=2666075 RepID=A0A7X2L5V5_9BACL|nr:hypothetical protein [Paenibacillus monticola]MRN57381.1 hypothetical protein [Paenibacillus monticola]
MSSKQLIFKEDEVERLRTKIGLLSQDTNHLYLQLKGQASNWNGIPLGNDLQQAQVLLNELTVEAEKLEDVIRGALKGVKGLQEENRRAASQLGQQWSALGGLFGSLGGHGNSNGGRISIPAFAQKAATNLIHTVASLLGWDELNQDPRVQQLQGVIKQIGIGTVEKIAAQSELKDIFEARDQIAKAQTAFGVYKAFGNQSQMNAMHKLAEDARAKLESLGIDEVQYQAGKDLGIYYKQAAVRACDYDPSITTSSVPLVQNEAYQLLLRMAMGTGDQADWAKGQLESIHATMKQMIATGVNLGVHVMTNQGAEAWKDVAQFTSSIVQLGSYNLFIKKAQDEKEENSEKSKNAFFKSLDSFKEIGTAFVGTLRTRADKATDSPYDFFNWLTLGITGDLPVAMYEGAKDRSDHMFDSKEKFADWLTLGTVEMAKGAFNPEEAWSADHWMNSLGMVTLLYGPVEKSLLPTGGGLPKPKLPKTIDPVQEINARQSPQFSTNEGLQFNINDIQTDTKSLPKTPVQIHFNNEMDIIRKEQGGKAIEGTGEGTNWEVKTSELVPTVKSGKFNDWFNSKTPDELDELWKDKKIRKAIERELRAPGGMHEWHLVSRAPTFKRWGVSADQVRELRTAISEVEFVNPTGKHGGLGSTAAHNELLRIIDSSTSYDMFIRRLNNWANYRLNGGINSLPPGLRLE